jgi:hypothetical protein
MCDLFVDPMLLLVFVFIWCVLFCLLFSNYAF